MSPSIYLKEKKTEKQKAKKRKSKEAERKNKKKEKENQWIEKKIQILSAGDKYKKKIKNILKIRRKKYLSFIYLY